MAPRIPRVLGLPAEFAEILGELTGAAGAGQRLALGRNLDIGGRVLPHTLGGSSMPDIASLARMVDGLAGSSAMPRVPFDRAMSAADSRLLAELASGPAGSTVQLRPNVTAGYQRGLGYWVEATGDGRIDTRLPALRFGLTEESRPPAKNPRARFLRDSDVVRFGDEPFFEFADPGPKVFRGGYLYPDEMGALLGSFFDTAARMPGEAVALTFLGSVDLGARFHRLLGMEVVPGHTELLTVISHDGRRTTHLSPQDRSLVSGDASGIFLREGDLVQFGQSPPFIYRDGPTRRASVTFRGDHNRVGSAPDDFPQLLPQAGSWVSFHQGGVLGQALFEPYAGRILLRLLGPQSATATFVRDGTVVKAGLQDPFVSLDARESWIVQLGDGAPFYLSAPHLARVDNPRLLAFTLDLRRNNPASGLHWALGTLGLDLDSLASRLQVEEAYRRRRDGAVARLALRDVEALGDLYQVEAAFAAIERALERDPGSSQN